MPFPSHLLTDVAIISRFLGRDTDAFATPLYGAHEEIRGAFLEDIKKVRTTTGDERISNCQFVTRTKINAEDRVWLPLETGVTPDDSDDEKARCPIANKADRSRSSGFRLHVAYFAR